jgi:hypothetical protein
MVLLLFLNMLQLLVNSLFEFPSLLREEVSTILDAQIGKHGGVTKAWRHEVSSSQCDRLWSVFVSKYRDAKARQQQ